MTQESQVVFWKQVKTVDESTPFSEKALLVLHTATDIDAIAHFARSLHAESVVYISFTKSYGVIAACCTGKFPKFYVLDFVSASIFPPKESETCSIRPAPHNYEALLDVLKQVAQQHEPDAIIFDSLSQILEIQEPNTDDLCRFLDGIHQHSPAKSKLLFLFDESVSKKLRFVPQDHFNALWRIESRAE